MCFLRVIRNKENLLKASRIFFEYELGKLDLTLPLGGIIGLIDDAPKSSGNDKQAVAG